MKRLPVLLTLVILLLSACSNLPRIPENNPSTGDQMGSTPEVVTATPEVVNPDGQQTAGGAANEAPTQPAQGQPTEAAAPDQPTTPVDQGSSPQPGALNGEEFDLALAQAIESRDFAKLRALMGGAFTVAGWRSEGHQVTPDQAIADLQNGALAAGSAPEVTFGKDLRALLDGADPLALFGPGANVVRAFFVDGAGPQAQDEAIVIVASDPASGSFYWYGVLTAFGGFQSSGGQVPDDQAAQQIAQAVESRNFEAMRALMKDRFSFATFNTQLIEVSADEAIQQLREGKLANGSQPAVRWGTDVVALLNGSDPLGLFGPNAQPVRAVHVMGLGANTAEEAVLVIGRDPASGQFYFHGIILPQFGYFQAADSDPNVLPTDVRYVEALDVLNARSGPGTNYAVEGQLREGEIATVVGKSVDGGWWRIACTQDSSGHCWISADPALTRPTQAP